MGIKYKTFFPDNEGGTARMIALRTGVVSFGVEGVFFLAENRSILRFL